LKKHAFKILYISLGILAISIGAVVRFIPGIPTTPFLFLALYCFNKSSEKLSAWLKNSYLYKKYLEGYVKHRAMTLRQKLTIQIFASTMMIISFISIPNLVFRIVMAVLFIAHHYVFIFRIRTLKPDDAHNENKSEEELQVRREREKDMLLKMISLYCRKRHGRPKGELCPDCLELLNYAHARCEQCPHMATKTSCKKCTTPCYKPEMREKIRGVMRWSGPRMLLYHPIIIMRYKFFH